MRKSKKKAKRIIAITFIVIIIGALWAFTVFMYNDTINKRFESYKPLMFKVEDFEGLNCTKYEFHSNKGQMLAGSLYSAGDTQKGIIILHKMDTMYLLMTLQAMMKVREMASEDFHKE